MESSRGISRQADSWLLIELETNGKLSGDLDSELELMAN
jgi:hypothetical protein